MNTSRVLTIVFVLAVLSSVGATYYRYMVQKDFLVKYETPCDPSQGTCFVYECDPEIEECTGNLEEDTTYYSLMYRKAFNIPACDAGVEGDCDSAYICPLEEAECSVVTCDEETSLGEETTCSNPEDFVAEEMVEEESEMEEEVMDETPTEEETAMPTTPAEAQTLEIPATAPDLFPVAPTNTESPTVPADPVAL